MKLIEADAKDYLRNYGLSVPRSAGIFRAGAEAKEFSAPVAVKAQVLQGNRAHAGLVEIVDAAEAPAAIQRVLSATERAGHEPLVLVEDQVAFTTEYYVAWRIDDLNQCPMMLFSATGGTGIEDRADAVSTYLHPALAELLPQRLTPFLRDCGVPDAHIGAVARYCAGLYEVLLREEALLLEVNPLVITTRGQAMALDAKMILDENAGPRHLDRGKLFSAKLQADAATPLELRASKSGFTFVELEGNIAIFSAGAGLGMCLLDVLGDAGIPAANFSDATGGAGAEKWAQMAEVVFEHARSDKIDAVLVFFVLTATSLKAVIDGLLMAIERSSVSKPIVVGLMAGAAAEREITLEEVQALLRSKGLRCVNNIAEVVGALTEVIGEQRKIA